MPATRHDRLANRILLVCGAVVAVALTSGLWFRTQQVALDAETLCPANQPAHGLTLVLVDKTDPMTPAQVAALKRDIRNIAAGLDKYERLSIFLIDAEVGRTLHPTFSRCSPGSKDQANPLTENPRRIGDRFEAEFGTPLTEAFDALTAPATTPTSPILEAIRAATHSEAFADSDPPRRLVVVSDMLHNTPALSLYEGAPSRRSWRDSAYARSVQADLAGSDVRLLVLERAASAERQSETFEAFWRAHLTDAGAAAVAIDWR